MCFYFSFFPATANSIWASKVSKRMCLYMFSTLAGRWWLFRDVTSQWIHCLGWVGKGGFPLSMKKLCCIWITLILLMIEILQELRSNLSLGSTMYPATATIRIVAFLEGFPGRGYIQFIFVLVRFQSFHVVLHFVHQRYHLVVGGVKFGWDMRISFKKGKFQHYKCPDPKPTKYHKYR